MNVWLHRYAVLVACCTFVLIIAGALVTSNDAGLAVPDWPTSFGGFNPPMVGGVFYEHGHRMVASAVGLLTIILAVWLWRTERRRWIRRLGWIALAAVVAQGLLGGLTVIFLLPTPVSVAHACLAQAFFCLTVALALFTSRSWQVSAARLEPSGGPAIHPLTLVTAGAVYLQLILGATLRHSAISVAPHVLGAIAVSVLVLATSIRVFRFYGSVNELVRPAALLVSFLIVQLFAGLGAYWVRISKISELQPTHVSVVITTTHVAAGALVLATAVVLALRCHRRVRRPGTLGVKWASDLRAATVRERARR